jgi:hypothetical protein
MSASQDSPTTADFALASNPTPDTSPPLDVTNVTGCYTDTLDPNPVPLIVAASTPFPQLVPFATAPAAPSAPTSETKRRNYWARLKRSSATFQLTTFHQAAR